MLIVVVAEATFTRSIARRWAILEEREQIAQNLVEMSTSEFGVACTSSKRVVEIDVKKQLITLLCRDNPEPRSKFGRVKVQLRVPARTKAKALCDRI